MMGFKQRLFTSLTNVSLDDLVPADHFYRHLERTLDLSFVRDLVRPCYAAGGRPSIDPIVFFKLQLVMFFEGSRSERHLMRSVADRLSARWYVGYDLHESLPDHSSLTKIRERYGVDIFRRFFDAVLAQCQAAGLIWGAELYADATKVQPNASYTSYRPRFFVEAHLNALFADDPTDTSPTEHDEEAPMPLPIADLPVAPSIDPAALTAMNEARHDWLARHGRPLRDLPSPSLRCTADYSMSTTDPDATFIHHKDGGPRLGYQAHYLVDGGKARIILHALVTPADVMENTPMLDQLRRVMFRWRVRPKRVIADTTYATIDNIRALEGEEDIRAYVPLPDWEHKTAYYGPAQFTYDAEHDRYACPEGTLLHPYRRELTAEKIEYRADAAICNACPMKAACTPSDHGRQVHRSFHAAYLDRVRGYHETEEYQKAMGKRKVWVEPLFGETKQRHGMRQFRLRGLMKVNIEGLFIAAGQNLKRLLSATGWGRRPWPDGTAGFAGLTPQICVARS